MMIISTCQTPFLFRTISKEIATRIQAIYTQSLPRESEATARSMLLIVRQFSEFITIQGAFMILLSAHFTTIPDGYVLAWR